MKLDTYDSKAEKDIAGARTLATDLRSDILAALRRPDGILHRRAS